MCRDLPMMRVKKLRFYHRWGHRIMLWFGKEPTVYKMDIPLRASDTPAFFSMEAFFLCADCKTYQSWDFGCADDHPEVCDDCWNEQERDERVKA